MKPPLLLVALSSLSSLVTVSVSASASATQFPFQPAETSSPLARRQQDGGCLANFYSCASQGAAFAGICCANGQVCRLDAANQPACCPANAVCTGTAPASFVPPSTSISYVPNAYFSFPYAPSSFADTAACSSAVSQCGTNYDSCTSRLEGVGAGGSGSGGGGVTVVVSGSATSTVVGGGGGAGGAGQVTGTLPTASATSICSSLSSAACHGLETGMCAGAGVTTGGFVIGTGGGSGNAAAPRQTGCAAVGMIMLAGVGLGVVHGF